MSGTTSRASARIGVFADLLRQRFALACRKLGINRTRDLDLDTAKFAVPRAASAQGSLF